MMDLCLQSAEAQAAAVATKAISAVELLEAT
ncbi:MAG: hypothetical protein ACI9BK_003239, partial [Acidimicrobiales bacterium]